MTSFQEQKTSLRTFAFQGLIDYDWNETELLPISVTFSEIQFFNVINFLRENVIENEKITVVNDVEFNGKSFNEVINLSNCIFKVF